MTSASSGRGTEFRSVFGTGKTTGNHILTVSQMPSEIHDVWRERWSTRTASAMRRADPRFDVSINAMDDKCGGGSYNHTLSLDLQFVDMIIASKD